MTDTAKTEGQPAEDELIPVDTPPEEKAPEPEAQTDDDEDPDDGDEGDERLGEGDDSDDEKKERRRSESKRRREAQRRAREAKDRRLEELTQEVAALRSTTIHSTLSGLDERIAKAAKDAEQAERIEVEASAAGNTDDVLLARRVRDAAVAEANRLYVQRQKLAQDAEPKPAGVPPQIEQHRSEWLAANSWFDPTGSDQYSALTKAIDTEVARDGFDPGSREYWQELTRRAGEAIAKLEGTTGSDRQPDARRKGPPIGGGREHAPPSTRGREIYVTPERKQAMIDAGVWDDPAARQRYLKAYQDYDKNSAR